MRHAVWFLASCVTGRGVIADPDHVGPTIIGRAHCPAGSESLRAAPDQLRVVAARFIGRGRAGVFVVVIPLRLTGPALHRDAGRLVGCAGRPDQVAVFA